MGYDPETDQVTRVYRFSTAADAEDGDTITQAQLDAAIDEVVAAINAALPAKLSVDAVATISITWRGAWAPETAYAVGDIVRESGSSYICVTAHTSAVDGAFSLDLSAGKWDVLAEKGAAGEGTGDMLGENNLSDVADKTTALATLGGQPKNVALTNLANVAVGLIAKTNSDGTMTPRSIVVTANTGISVTNGDGVAGNPTVSAVTRTQAQWNAGTDTTEAVISPAKLASVRPPDAHFAGASSPTSTGTLPITVTLRNVITARAALASNTFTLQPGQYFVQISASVRANSNVGSNESASVALVTATDDGIGIVFSARGLTLGVGGQGTSGFYLSPATATGYRLNFARDSANWVASQGSLTSAHAGMAKYDHEVLIWRIA